MAYVIQEYKPHVYDAIIQKKEGLGPYSKELITRFLNGTTHIYLWEFRNILDILGLDITFSVTDDKDNTFIDHEKITKHQQHRNKIIKKLVIQRTTPIYDKFNKYINVPASATDEKKQLCIERQMKYFGQVYQAGHFDNMLLELLTQAGKENKIYLLINDKGTAKKLGLSDNEPIEKWLHNQSHILWFDIINILRFSNLKLHYDISYKDNLSNGSEE